MPEVDFHLNETVTERITLHGRDTALPFHQSHPGYESTKLHRVPDLARRLGIDELWVKEESNRFGLPAYKILGASWAIARELSSYLDKPARCRAFSDVAALAIEAGELTLVAATDGNHGRAVARVARWLGLAAEIFVPGDMTAARIEAIRSEGASVRRIEGSYDEAVRQASVSAGSGGDGRLLVQDTAWPGYERVPEWIVDGYGTIFQEIDAQLEEGRLAAPNLVLIQMGVGSLAAAATRHFRSGERRAGEQIRLLGVEPLGADCVLRSVQAGRPVEVGGPHLSVMAGLNCGTPSRTALPLLQQGMDAFLAISDDYAHEAMRLLATAGIVAGESGAAGLAGLLAIREKPELTEHLVFGAATRALVIVTEADTDPESYERAVGRPSRAVRNADLDS